MRDITKITFFKKVKKKASSAHTPRRKIVSN